MFFREGPYAVVRTIILCLEEGQQGAAIRVLIDMHREVDHRLLAVCQSLSVLANAVSSSVESMPSRTPRTVLCRGTE